MENEKEQVTEVVEQKETVQQPIEQQTNTQAPNNPAPSYANKLQEMEQEKQENENLKREGSRLEKTLKNSITLTENIDKFLKRTNHPKSSQYNEIIQDIKSGGYNVVDENDHINLVAAKLFLDKDEIPSSLKADYDVIAKSNYLTPANKASLEKLKIFTESAIEKQNRQADRAKLLNDFGPNEKNLDPEDFSTVVRLFQSDKISLDDYNRKRKEFLSSNKNSHF